ncbi:MAG: type III secretion system export apparatus subunit SctS [Sphingomonas sp.]
MSGAVIGLTIQALWLVLVLSAPPIIVASALGLIVAVVQAATQLQEQTFQYTVKFLGVVVTIFLTISLLAGSLLAFADDIFSGFAGLVGR